MEDTTNDTTQSEEMNRFYRALAVAQANLILYVANAADLDEMKGRAAAIARQLEILVIENFRGDKCAENEIFNPITKKCEPI